jgi:hypothetical protein
MHSFYNTAKLSGEELKQAIAHAKSQEETILLLFTNRFRTATPSQVKQALKWCDKHWEITSVRRALSNLTKDGKLEKTHHQRPGPHGMPEHIWQLATQPEQSQ